MRCLKKKSLCLSLIFICSLTIHVYWIGFFIRHNTQTELMSDTGDKGRRSPPQFLSDAVEITGEETVRKSVGHSDTGTCFSWCRRGARTQPPYFLTAVLLVRIYTSDLAKLSTRELHQWLYYLRYAGVEHVYVYDAYHYKDESQQNALDPWVTDGYVTYVDWSHRAKPFSIGGTQVSAYQDCIDRWGNLTTWQTSIDIDEYPFSPSDTKPGFMVRFIKIFTAQHSDLYQITMQNFLFLGKPLNDTEQPFLIDKLRRRTKTAANALVKQIYQPKFVYTAGVHHHIVKNGRSRDIPADGLRMNHYWGARAQNWGEDTEEILSETEPDNSMEAIVGLLKKCDICLPKKEFVYRVQWS